MGNKSFWNWFISHSMCNVHVAVVVVAALLYAISQVSVYKGLEKWSIGLMAAGVIFFLFHTNLNRQYHFLYDNQNMRTIPQQKIRKYNRFFIMPYLLCACIVMALVLESFSGHLFSKLKDLFSSALAWLLGKFFEKGELHTGDVNPEYRFGFLNHADGYGAGNDGFFDTVIYVVQGALIILGIVLVCTLLIWLLRRLWAQLKDEYTDKRGSIVAESRDITTDLTGRKGKRLSVFSSDPNVRIRRFYKSAVKRRLRKNKILPRFLTPADVEQVAGFSASAVNNQIHDLYEKARYSRQGCSMAESEQMKKLLKRKGSNDESS